MRRPVQRALATLLTGAAIASAATASAAAAPDWNLGLPEELLEQTCTSIGAGGLVGYQTELGTSVRAGMLVDPQAIPEVGDVFYGGVTMSAVGGCSSKAFAPEAILPLGVELAVSAAHPVRCHYTLPDGSDTPITDGCPQSPQRGPYGGLMLTPRGDPGNVWADVGRIPGSDALSRPQLETLYVEFPLRASRPLLPLPGGPGCAERAARTAPCARDAAGDFLQVAVRVIALGGTPTLIPAIGLAVEPGGGGPGAGTGGGRLLTAPRALGMRRALRGIAITVTAPAARTRVTATLSVPGLGRVALARRTAARAGRLRLRLKPTARSARRLRRRPAVTARVKVTVRAPGGRARTATARIRLRR
jgi:hypothetical protein